MTTFNHRTDDVPQRVLCALGQCVRPDEIAAHVQSGVFIEPPEITEAKQRLERGEGSDHA